MATLGTTARLVQLSISAKMGMNSPTKGDAHVGGACCCLKGFQHRGLARVPATTGT